MPIVHANGETAELIFTCTPNSAVCAAAAGSLPPADTGLRSRRLKTSRHRRHSPAVIRLLLQARKLKYRLH